MAHILVPVDFSTNSQNAFVYALSLAERFGLEVKVLHIYNRSFVPNEPMRFEGKNSLEELDEQRLREFAQSCLNNPLFPGFTSPLAVKVQYETVLNLSPADGIRAVADDDDIEMIVMGTSNKTGVFANWLGSTASAVSETISKPVMLIPPSVRFTNYRNILVANHYETTDHEILDHLATWAKLFSATLHFVHIIQATDHFPYQFVTKSINEQFSTTLGMEGVFKVANLKDHSIAGGLEQYAETHHTDLTIIVNRERSKWSALLKSSLTKQMALTTKTPLLVMHSEAFYQPRSNA